MIVRLPNPMSAVVWLAFLVPGPLYGGWTDRAFGAAVFLLSCAVLRVKPSPWEARAPSAQALKIFLLIEFLGVASLLYSAAFNGIQIGPRDGLELLRYVFLGAFVVYLIRHHDSQVRAATEWAMTAALYVSMFRPATDATGYVAVLTLCYLLFFSRRPLRFLHAAAAVYVVFSSGDRRPWTAAFLVLSAAASLSLYRVLVRRNAGLALASSLALGALLLAGPIVFLGSRGRAAASWPRSSPGSETLRFVRRSPLLGWGPAQDEAIPCGDSQYLRWLLRGGALGAGAILSGLALCGYRLLCASNGDSTRLVGAAAFLGGVALMLSAGRFLDGFRLFFLTAFFAASAREASR